MVRTSKIHITLMSKGTSELKRKFPALLSQMVFKVQSKAPVSQLMDEEHYNTLSLQQLSVPSAGTRAQTT